MRDLKDNSQPQWLVTLIVRQHASEDQPYAFSVELEGYFSIFSSRFDEAGSEKLLRTNGAAVLYGVAREMIRSLTAHGPYLPAFRRLPSRRTRSLSNQYGSPLPVNPLPKRLIKVDLPIRRISALSRRSREARRIHHPENTVIESLPLTLRAASSSLSSLRSDSVKKMLSESKFQCTIMLVFYAKKILRLLNINN